MSLKSLERKDVLGFLYIMNSAENLAREQINKEPKNSKFNSISIGDIAARISDEIPESLSTVTNLFNLMNLLTKKEPEDCDFNNIRPPAIRTLNSITCYQAGSNGFFFKDVISDHKEIIDKKFEGKVNKTSLDVFFGSKPLNSANDPLLKEVIKDLGDNGKNKDTLDPLQVFSELLDSTFRHKESLTIKDEKVGYMYRGLKAALSSTGEKLKHIQGNLRATIKYKIKGDKEVVTYKEKGRLEVKVISKKGGVFIYYTIFSGVALLLASVESLSDGMLLDQLNLMLGDNLDTSLTLDSNLTTEKKDEKA